MHKQRDVQQQQQQLAAQAEPSRGLWGELPSAEAGAGASFEDARAHLSQRRLRRARRQYAPPLMAHLQPEQQQWQPHEQPQQQLQRHRQPQRRGKAADDDSLSDDDLTFLGARWGLALLTACTTCP